MECPNCKNKIDKSYIESIPWIAILSGWHPLIEDSHLIIHTKTIHCNSCNKDIKISVEYPLENADQVKVEIL